jgi:surface polysaccharide O-acyltransferase-like enzyme
MATPTKKSPRNYWIDLVRLIMAIFVIGIHASRKASFAEGPYQWITIANPTLFRTAVPFFFLCSAFFTYKIFLEHNRDPKVFFKAALRYFILYTFWIIVFIPTTLKETYFGTGKAPGAYALWFIQEFFLNSPIPVFWFLRACAYGLAVLGLLALLKIKPIYVLPFAIVFYIYGAYGDTYYGLLNDYLLPYYNNFLTTFYTTRDMIFFGLPLLIIGAEIAELYANKQPSIALGIIMAILAAISLYLLYLEVHYLITSTKMKDYNICLSLLLFEPCFFIALLSIRTPFPARIGKYFGPVSSLLYLTHIAWRDFYEDLYIGNKAMLTNLNAKFAFTLGCTFLFALLILYLTRHWKLSRWFY